MKWALALALVTVVGVVVALVVAIGSTRDTAPERLRACVIDGGGGIVLSDADLGAQVRSDIGARSVREVARAQVGDDDVALRLRGTDFQLLVLAGRKSPSLTGDVPRRVFERASDYALVAKQDGARDGVLRDCIALAAGPQSGH